MKKAASNLIASLLALALLFISAFAHAAEPSPHTPKPPAAAPETVQLWPADSITHHSLAIGAERFDYATTAGTLPLLGPKGEIKAKVFYAAYTLEGASSRPVTFVFNGGPGAAAAFLHLAALGPRVVNFVENGSAPVQPVRLADNPDSWLPFTDLVFVDPVGTGFSRATEGEEAAHAFWGVDKDADAMTAFSRLYLAKNGRELSPIFIAGESYGGFRACLVAKRLLEAGIQVKGAVLISPALEFSMLRGDEYTLIPLALELPSIAAAHIELKDGQNAPLEPLREVEQFARNGYLHHLVNGLRNDEGITGALARYTGLDPDIIGRHHGRVSTSLFLQTYRRKNSRSLSRYDGSVSVPLPSPPEGNHFDPILEGAVTVLSAAMTQYTRQELGFRTDLQYELLNRTVSSNWDFGTKPNRQGFAGALDDLEKARTQNPALRVLVVQGYTDLVVPYSVSQFLVDQLRPIENAAPIQVHVYKGGHMMYMRPDSRRRLKEDAGKLYLEAIESH